MRGQYQQHRKPGNQSLEGSRQSSYRNQGSRQPSYQRTTQHPYHAAPPTDAPGFQESRTSAHGDDMQGQASLRSSARPTPNLPRRPEPQGATVCNLHVRVSSLKTPPTRFSGIDSRASLRSATAPTPATAPTDLQHPRNSQHTGTPPLSIRFFPHTVYSKCISNFDALLLFEI